MERIRNQVDIASTLALHLGVNIPFKNYGVPLYEEIDKLPLNQQLSIHYRLSKQLSIMAYQLLGESETMCMLKEYFFC